MIEEHSIFGKDYRYFSEVDPYNKQNTVEGLLCTRSTEYYGALIIRKINNKIVPEQLIMGTPKMHYPFYSLATGQRKYTFPSVKSIEIFEKLDGTNILAFFYTDGLNRYMAFKTRLMPFVNANSKFGNFYQMWNEVASSSFAEIKRCMIEYKCNMSFELYGSKNIHLVLYSTPLDYALLFGVTNSGNIFSPTKIDTQLHKTPLLDEISSDYVWSYEQLQKKLNSSLKATEEYYTGTEGAVWYLHHQDSRCLQIKCKPEIIEAIHFAASGGITKNIILTTCWNALENTDILTSEFIKELLAEEFTSVQIDKASYRIQECIEFVNDQLEFRNIVLSEYKKIGLNFLLDKAAVMRKFSESGKVPKKMMQKVYTILTTYS